MDAASSKSEPRERRVPCVVCGAPVDPLRAPRVSVRKQTFFYYCTREHYEKRAENPVLPAYREVSVVAREPVAEEPDQASVEEMASLLGIDAPQETVTNQDVRAKPLEPSIGTLPKPIVVPVPAENQFSSIKSTELPLWPALVVGLFAMVATILSYLPTESVLLWGGLVVSAVVNTALSVWVLRRSEQAQKFAAVLALVVAMLVAIIAVVSAKSSLLGLVAPSLAGMVWSLLLADRLGAQQQQRLRTLEVVLPREASTLREDGSWKREDARLVKAGQLVEIGEGEYAPIDGVVKEGTATVLWGDNAASARLVMPGDSILAGALVRKGTLRVLSTVAGDEVALTKVVHRLEQTGERGNTAVLVTLLGGAVGVLGVAVQWSVEGVASIGLLLTAMSAVPASFLGVLGNAAKSVLLQESARRGVIFRDAQAVAKTGAVELVVFCVQGTLRRGVPELVEVVSLGNRDERALLALACAAEEATREDPLARAVYQVARLRGVNPEPARRSIEHVGLGVSAVVPSGETVLLGSRALLLSEGVSVAVAEDCAQVLEAQGRVASFLAIAGRVEGVFGFEDPMRDEARATTQSLLDAGIDVALLGGESRGTLEALALVLDVSRIRPEVPRSERVDAVRSMSEVSGAGGVAVVAKPGKDAGVLSAADVGIALGAAGGANGPVAVALATEDLRDVSGVLLMARSAKIRTTRAIAVACGVWFFGSVLVSFVPGPGVWTALVVSALGCWSSWALATRGLSFVAPGGEGTRAGSGNQR